MKTKLFELTEAQAEELRNILTSTVENTYTYVNPIFAKAIVGRLEEIKDALKWEKGQIIHE